jgi:DNA-binding NtrC family response regulator
MSEQNVCPSPRLLLVEDDDDIRIVFVRWLRAAGYEVQEATSLEQALERLSSWMPDAVCLDLGLPDAGGIGALEVMRRREPSLPILVLTAETDVDVVVTAMQKGTFGYLAKPVSRERLVEAARRAAIRGRMEQALVGRDSGVGRGAARLAGASASMAELRARIRRVAASEVAVLVQGESGVGKELVARAIHEESPRHAGPFVALNCAAIPESLQESELFGHEKGAFTGAVAQKRGYFELAAGGTLFLDEVAELAPSLQAKLLRAVQEKVFRRVGGTVDVASDFRILSASHKLVWDEVAADRFRSDLYYRIAVFELKVPPLRDRGEDVLFLCRSFMNDQLPDGHVALSPEAEQLLLSYSWPGNVRELKNALHHALVLRSSDTLTGADFPDRIQSSPAHSPLSAPAHSPLSAPALPLAPPIAKPAEAPDGRLDSLERQAIEQMIASVNGSITEAARRLGISRATLYRRLKQYQPPS